MKRFGLFSIIFVILAVSVWGQDTYTWIGGGATNDWDDIDNWDSVYAPVPWDDGDNLIIQTSAGGFDPAPSAAITVGTLTIIEGTFTLGDDLTVSEVTIAADGILSAAGYTITVDNEWNDGGNFSHGNGTVEFVNAEVNAFNAFYDVICNGTVTIDGTVSNKLTIRTGTTAFSNAITVAELDVQDAATSLYADSLLVIGTSTIGANITTSGNQIYSEAVTLSKTVSLESTGVGIMSFADEIDGGGYDLTVTTENKITFNKDVSDVGTLTVNGEASIGADITTTDTQTYNDKVTLAKDVTLEGTQITFVDIDGNNNELIINGDVEFNGEAKDIKELTVNGDLTIGVDGEYTAAGDITVNGGEWTNEGDFDHDGHKVTFINATVNGSNTFGSVECIGLVIFADNLTQTITTLLHLESGSTVQSQTTGSAQWRLDAGSVTTNPSPTRPVISDCYSVTYIGLIDGTDANDADNNYQVFYVSLFTWTGAANNDWSNAGNWSPVKPPNDNSANILIPESGVTNEPVFDMNVVCGTLTIAVSRELAMSAYTLKAALINNSGTIKITANVSDQVEVGGLTPVSINGTIQYLSGSINWAFGNTYENLTVNSGAAMTDAVTLVVNGTAMIGANITASVTQTYYGDILLTDGVTFSGAGAKTFGWYDTAIDGYGNSLTVTGAGEARFNCEIINVDTLAVTGSVITIVQDITTTGDQTYTGPVDIGSDKAYDDFGIDSLTLEGYSIIFGSTVDAAASVLAGGCILNLTIDATSVTFGGRVGGTRPVTSITVDAAATFNGTNAGASATGDQNYQDVTLSGTAPSFTSTGIDIDGIVYGSISAVGQVTGTGGITINASQGISVQNAVNSISGTVVLNNNEKGTPVGSVDPAGDVNFLSTGDVTISGNNASDPDDGGEFNITANGITVAGITSETVTLISTGTGASALTQTATINTPSLTVTSGGAITLDDDDNEIDALKIISSGGAITVENNKNLDLEIISAGGAIEVTNTAPLEIAGIAAGANSVSITTTGSGSHITQSGAIVTTNILVLSSSGSIKLDDDDNEVDELLITGAGGDVEFANSVELEIAGISAIGQSVEITTDDAVTVSGSVISDDFTITAGDQIDIDGIISSGGVVSLISEDDTDININEEITAERLALKAGTSGTSTGEVKINEDITVTANGTEGDTDPNPAAIYIWTHSLTVDGAIITPGTTGQVCIFADEVPTFANSGEIFNNHWHLHPREDVHIVYRAAGDTSTAYSNVGGTTEALASGEFCAYTAISGMTLNLSTWPNSVHANRKNIYIIDVGDNGNANVAFTTDGYIEIRGAYASTGSLVFNTDTVRLVNSESTPIAPTVLELPSFDISSATLNMRGGTVTPASITVTTGNISLGDITSRNADGTNSLTLNSINASIAVGAMGTIPGGADPADRLGNIILTAYSSIDLSENIYVASLTVINAETNIINDITIETTGNQSYAGLNLDDNTPILKSTGGSVVASRQVTGDEGITINASQGISLAFTANSLSGTVTLNNDLGAPVNDVDFYTTGNVTVTGINNDGKFSITADGITVGDGTVGIEAIGQIVSLTSATPTGTPDVVTQVVGGTGIAAETLILSGAAAFTLENAANNISTLETGTVNPVSISYRDSADFELGTINAVESITLWAGAGTVDGTAGTITTKILELKGIAGTEFDLSNSGNQVESIRTAADGANYPEIIDFANGIDFAIDTGGAGGLWTTDSIILRTSETVSGTSTNGSIRTGTLILYGEGITVYNLTNNSNNVTTIQTDSAGTDYPLTINYTDSSGFDIGASGLETSDSITLQAGGNVTQTGEITTGALILKGNSSAAYTLNEDNTVISIATQDAGTGDYPSVIDFYNDDALEIGVTIGTDTYGLQTTVSGRIVLHADGDIEQIGTITTGNLILKGDGNTFILEENNAVTNIATQAVDTTKYPAKINFKNAGDLNIGVTVGTNTYGLNTLVTTPPSPPLYSITLDVTGDIIQPLTGTRIITTDTLMLTGMGEISLGNSNEVRILTVNYVSEDLTFTNNQTLDITKINANKKDVTVRVNSGDINVTVTGDIKDALVLTLEAFNSLTISGDIISGADNSRAVLKTTNTGTVTINGTITVLSEADGDGAPGHTENDAAIYINTGTLAGSGRMNPGPSTGEVCVWISVTTTYTGTVPGDRIHYHISKPIVYRSGADTGIGFSPVNGRGDNISPDSYVYVRADLNLGPIIHYYTSDNIYIIDVGDTSPYANTREARFYAGGKIEIRGAYTSSGTLNLNPGTGQNVQLINNQDDSAPASLNLPSFTLATPLLVRTVGAPASISTNNGDIRLGAITGENNDLSLTTSADDILITGDIQTINDISFNGNSQITVQGAIGTSVEEIGDITVTTTGGTVTFNDTIDAASFLQMGTGSTTFYSAQNYSGSFDFTGAVLTVDGDITADAGIIITNSGLFNLTSNITLDSAAANLTVSGKTSGSGNLTVLSMGTVQFGDTIDTNGAFTFTGSSLTADGVMTIGGSTTITNSGLFALNAELNSAGSVTQSGGGSSTLAADITASNADTDIDFTNEITLNNDIQLSAPRNIFLRNEITGNNYDFTILAANAELDAALSLHNFTFTGGALTVNGYLTTSAVVNITNTGNFTVTAPNGHIQPGQIMTVTGNTINNGAITAGPVAASSAAIDFRGNYDASGGTVGVLNGNTSTRPDIQFGANVILGDFTHNDNRIIFYEGAAKDHNLTILSSAASHLYDVIIREDNKVTLPAAASDSVIQSNGSTLTLEDNTILDISKNSWYMGETNTPPASFAGYHGTLNLGQDSRLITNNLYLEGISSANYITVNNTKEVTITVEGDVDIKGIMNSGIDYAVPDGQSVKFTGDLPQLIIEMAGDGEQSFTTGQPIGSLHVRAGSTTILGSSLTVIGAVLIEYSDSGGILQAGSYNISMYAGLNKPAEGNLPERKLGRWIILNAPENVKNNAPITTHPMYAFIQNLGSSVTFKKEPSSGANVFFEIWGNTVWQKFICEEPEVVFQFSRNPDHHVFLDTFRIQGDDGKNITLTRTSGILYFDPITGSYTVTQQDELYVYDSALSAGHRPPGSTGSGTINYSLPGVPAPSNLKEAAEGERNKFWNFNLVTSAGYPTLEIENVTIYFSHAYNQRIPIAPVSTLQALPFYREIPTRVGYFNYDWINIRKIIYCFTEDGNGNGKLDRIRVQTSIQLNGDFSSFIAEVDDYEVDTSRGQNGYDLVSYITGSPTDAASFYIYLKEKPWLYNGEAISWRIKLNNSLMDSITGTNTVGSPEDDETYHTIDTIPPRISYALTLPGHNQTFFRMSKPVTDSVGGIISGTNVTAHQPVDTTPPGIVELNYYPFDEAPITYSISILGGVLSYLLTLDTPLTITDLAELPPIGDPPAQYFTLENMEDLSVRALDWRDPKIDSETYLYYPAPRYPADWNYSEYKEYRGNSHVIGADLTPDDDPENLENVFLPPYQVLTPEMMRTLEEYALERGDNPHSSVSLPKVELIDFSSGGVVKRRFTDVLVSLRPSGTDSDNYFAWPVWARYLDTSKHSTLDPDSSIFWGRQEIDDGIIWTFDGTSYLEDRDINLQARINKSSLSDFNGLTLFYGFNVPVDWRDPAEAGERGRTTGGLWLPEINLNKNPLYNIVPSTTRDAKRGLLSYYNSINKEPSVKADPLFNFDILKSESNFSSGGKVDFFFRLEGKTEVDPHLFIARLDAPQDTIPDNWYTLIRPFSFDIQDIRRQRGGVTILNNVINSDNNEFTYIRYHMLRSGRVTVQVYTLDGTLVKSLRRNEFREAGEWTDAWDGTNNGGRPVARGMYFVRVVAPDIDEIRKVMVVR